MGLIYVMVQTWFPMRMQVLVNGHSWLANKLAASGIKFTQCDKVFLWLEDLARAQRFADRLTLRLTGQKCWIATHDRSIHCWDRYWGGCNTIGSLRNVNTPLM